MFPTCGRLMLCAVLLFPSLLLAQADRPSCALLKSLDLKPLLGADHDAAVPFGQESCRAESNAPGRLVVLAVAEQPLPDLKKWFAGIKQMTAQHNAKEAMIVAEPALGADAFSVRSRGEMREVEFHAIKGSRAVILKGMWAIGAPLNDAGIKQFQQLMRAALDKLP
jgi:hypothetical protein